LDFESWLSVSSETSVDRLDDLSDLQNGSKTAADE
jgi:hypothetical protein